MTLYAKMASPDLQGHPWKLCLIKYDLNIHVFVSSNCSFSFAISPHFLRLYEAMEKLSELNTYWGNTRKLFQKCMHVLYCSMLSLGGNDTALHWIHFSHKEKSMKYSGHRKLLCELSKLSKLMLLTSSDTRRTLIIYSCLQIPPKENWFQYARRVYTTAINFPCIITWAWRAIW